MTATHMDDIEAVKENLAPRPGGRSARSTTQRLEDNQAERQRLKAEIKEWSGRPPTEDLLHKYYTYTRLVQELPAHTVTPEVVADFNTTLSEAVRTFKEVSDLYNDDRLVWLWTKVVRINEKNPDKAHEVFRYMEGRGIGKHNSRFYITYAAWLASQNRWTDAERVFADGLTLGAQPKDKLEAKYRSFLAQKPDPEAPPSPTAAAPAPTPVLGTRGTGGIALAERPVAKPSSTIQVYKDRDGDSRRTIPASSAINPRQRITSVIEGKKENVRESTRWTGATLHQRGARSAPAAATRRGRPIEVFQDEPSEDNIRPAVPVENVLQEKELRPPSLDYRDDGDTPAISESQQSHPRVGATTEELSVEELRARDYFERVRREESERIAQEQTLQAKLEQERAQRDEEERIAREQAEQERLRLQQEQRPSPPRAPSAKPFAPSPTINTKAALADIYEMFSAPLRSEAEIEQRAAPTNEIYVEDDETISAKVWRDQRMSQGLGDVYVDEDDRDEPTTAYESPLRASDELRNGTRQPLMRPVEDQSSPFMEGSGFNKRGGLFTKEDGRAFGTIIGKDAEQSPLGGVASKRPLAVKEVAGRLGRSQPTHAFKAHSTPHMPTSEIYQSGSSDDEAESKTVDNDHTRPKRAKPYGFDVMTPISEHFSCENTIAGLSTIARERTFAADRTMGVERTFGERTIRNFGGRDILGPVMGQDEEDSDNEHEHAEHQMEIAAPATDADNKAKDDTAGLLHVQNPFDPFNRDFRASVCDMLNRSGYPGLIRLPNGSVAKVFEKFDRENHMDADGVTFDLLCEGRGHIMFKLGEGGFGSVYKVEKDGRPMLGSTRDDVDQSDEAMWWAEEHEWALKIQRIPGVSWEFYAMREVKQRLNGSLIADWIPRVGECGVWGDEKDGGGMLMIKDVAWGSFLDCLDWSGEYGFGRKTQDEGVVEELAMFWAIDVLRVIEGVHAAGFIHADIKPDNFLARIVACKAWDESDVKEKYEYDPSGGYGWNSRGLWLADWGRSIDLRRFGADTRFKVDRSEKPDPSIECWEMRNNIDWKYEADWYGAAGVLFCLLFGRYMTVIEEDNGEGERPHLRLAPKLKRYWRTEIWEPLFDLLLNAHSRNHDALRSQALSNAPAQSDIEDYLCAPSTLHTVYESEFPLIHEIRTIRRQMERYLTEISYKRNLRLTISKVHNAGKSVHFERQHGKQEQKRESSDAVKGVSCPEPPVIKEAPAGVAAAFWNNPKRLERQRRMKELEAMVKEVEEKNSHLEVPQKIEGPQFWWKDE
ncbi:Mad3/BUB1 homology region 1-domain-containing protein [Gaertneriomyces semiglobifer]|nr:Mad3/BUB1 homology region 1-domain-containing protein [Gaertneriomyces semiglobifer]